MGYPILERRFANRYSREPGRAGISDDEKDLVRKFDNALMGWSEDVVRRAELHPELHPLPIFAGDPPEPINATSAAIVRRRDERGDSFALELYDPAGSLLEFLQFETLEITLDQAAAIIGLHPADWRAGSGA